MVARPSQVVRIFIAAVGGQGGALLSDWLLEAAHQMGLRAHGVGIPGMSQRGGSTSYYVEMAQAEGTSPLEDLLLCPSPFPGEVDCLIGLELLELVRACQAGYCSSRTTVVGSTHRDYTIQERLPSYGKPVDEGLLLGILEKEAENVMVFDARALAQREGLRERQINALLLGAVAGSRALPLREESYRLAIKAVGVAPEENLRAFEVGLRHVLSGLPSPEEEFRVEAREHASSLTGAQRRALDRLLEGLPSGLPEALLQTLEVACGRLIEYEDEAYARGYLERVLALWRGEEPLGREGRLTETYALHLANLMAYEDPPRVASLKVDAGRFEHIERRYGIGPLQTYRVRERFRPELEEVLGLLPERLARWAARWVGPRTLPLRLETTSLSAMFVLRALAALKALRRRSLRRKKNEELLDSYTSHVTSLLERSYEVACAAARAAGFIRGYGETRRRTERLFRSYLEDFLWPLVQLDERSRASTDYSLTLRAISSVEPTLRPTGEGFQEAVALIERLKAHEASLSYPELLRLVEEGSFQSGRD